VEKCGDVLATLAGGAGAAGGVAGVKSHQDGHERLGGYLQASGA